MTDVMKTTKLRIFTTNGIIEYAMNSDGMLSWQNLEYTVTAVEVIGDAEGKNSGEAEAA